MSKKKAATRKVTKATSKASQARAAAANPVPVKDVARPPQAQGAVPTFRKPVSWNFAGVGRNDICPCGSGKRFKNCHGH